MDCFVSFSKPLQMKPFQVKSSERVPFMLHKGVAKRQNGWGRAAFRSLGQRYRARPG